MADPSAGQRTNNRAIANKFQSPLTDEQKNMARNVLICLGNKRDGPAIGDWTGASNRLGTSIYWKPPRLDDNILSKLFFFLLRGGPLLLLLL